jgi:hypothetical protein
MTSIAKLLAQKAQLVARLEEASGTEERDNAILRRRFRFARRSELD